MTDFRNDLLSRMIHLYGFENPLVIQFAESCNAYTWDEVSAQWDKILEYLVESHEAHPYFPDEEEEDF